MKAIIHITGEVEIGDAWFVSVQEFESAKTDFNAYACNTIKTAHPGFLSGVIKSLSEKAAAIGAEFKMSMEEAKSLCASKNLLGAVGLFSLGK